MDNDFVKMFVHISSKLNVIYVSQEKLEIIYDKFTKQSYDLRTFLIEELSKDFYTKFK